MIITTLILLYLLVGYIFGVFFVRKYYPEAYLDDKIIKVFCSTLAWPLITILIVMFKITAWILKL